MTNFLTQNYWNNRYFNQQIGWDLGEVSPPIKAYVNQLVNKDLKILIPGAGNAYEAVYLIENGFTNVTIIDFAEKPLVDLAQKLIIYNSQNYHLIQDDFFNLKGEFDLIVEQTFFCALHPSLRENYVKQTHNLINTKGKLVGLLFNKQFAFEGPPFGGTVEEYQALFQDKFEINTMDKAYNSVKPRLGSELFINFTKRGNI